jgi:uncharacterized protein (TIGR03643 family)
MVDEKLISVNNLPTVLRNYSSDSLDIIEEDKDRIIQMAWEDRTPFEAIEFQFGLKEKDVIEFMRKNSLPSSFKMWRKRMKSRKTKHSFLREKSINRFKCSRQRNSGNKISKR